MEEIEKILLNKIKEFYKNAVDLENKGDYDSSITLFFKSLAILGDLYIFRNEGILPSNHYERFRILEQKYYDIYKILDKDFLFYQNTYKILLNKENSIVLRKDVEQLLRILKINI